MTNLRGIGMTSQRTRDRLVQRLQQHGITNLHVLNAIRETPRHIFVDEALASRAYEDTALPIGFNQTISQPYIVALMTQALLLKGTPQRVLEIGTGSGYQTAILAGLIKDVYTVERIAGLQQLARKRLEQLEFRNIRFKHDDGNWGWQDFAPFDGILVTAAPDEVPMELLQQLQNGGRLIIPAGPNGDQQLFCFTRRDDEFEKEILDRVSFVPLVRGAVQK
jgi:protein-L-isoaspartate(D-aspartate) O-methyltransferase